MMGRTKLDDFEKKFDKHVRTLEKGGNWREIIQYAKDARAQLIASDPKKSSVKTIQLLIQTHLASKTAYIMLGNNRMAIKESEILARLNRSYPSSTWDRHASYEWLSKFQLEENMIPEARKSLHRSIACVFTPRTVEQLAIALSQLAAVEEHEGKNEIATYLKDLSDNIRKERRFRPKIAPSDY